jgi:hypothetical protein
VIEYTIGYVSVEGQVEADFDRARRRALFGRVSARLRGDCGRLLAFDEVRKALRADNQFCLGTRIVEVRKIVGSVGRWRQFDRCFMPAEVSTEDRWKRVDLAFRRNEELPPVSLYKIREVYFVLDGNHRVSVARYHGVEMIDAEVTEFRPRSLVNSPVRGAGQELQSPIPSTK